MATILVSDIPRRRAYRLLIGTVVPRPVAWISSRGRDGVRNLAPFSYFMGIGHDPPLLAVSINSRRGQIKDSLRNIQETGEFVVNIANEDLLERMVRTSGEWPYGVDEFEEAGLSEAASTLIQPGRVAEAPVAMECRLHHVTLLGNAPNLTGLVVGEILAWHIRDDILDDEGVPDMARLRPVGRMIDDEYMLLRERRKVPRPRVEG